MSSEPLLEIEDLKVHFETDEGVVKAVDGVSLEVRQGEMLGIVGESGSGKSVASMTVLGLTRASNAVIAGRITFEGRDLLAMDDEGLQEIRGNGIAMIFQDPLSALHPFYKVGNQLVEAVQVHQDLGDSAARARAVELLELVGIPDAERRMGEYPHEFSGGMRQRVMIAMALACRPELLLADEPTTALDVTIQAQVLDLMRALRAELRTAVMLITHDLGVVAEMADRVLVMYAGQVVEEAPVAAIFAMPQHPYTVGLMGAMPALAAAGARLAAIDGMVPAATAMPEGCRFAARCPFADPQCRVMPPLQDLGGGRRSRCWKVPLESLAASLPALQVAA